MQNYARYTGMAFELLVLILIMVFLGKKLDAWFHFEKSIMVVSLVCLGTIGYLVKLYYEINNNKDEK